MVDDLIKRIDALGSAIAKGDTAEVRRIGHAIKGGCGMAGAVQAAHLGALLEAAPLGARITNWITARTASRFARRCARVGAYAGC